MTPLRPELTATLASLYPGARIESLVADASTRKFHRLFLPSRETRIVMDYGAPFEGVTEDVRLARIFQDASLPVARIIEILPSAGCLVLEDMGDETLERALGRRDDDPRRPRLDLHRAATALASRIATRGTEALLRSDRASGPALDRQRFEFEMGFFLEHYVGGFLGRAEIGRDLRAPLLALAVTAAEHPRVLCHRDYHSRNIMVRDDGTLAMVDIQDARWGPDTYDLASLLRDAYVDLPEKEVDALFEYYVEHLRGVETVTQLRERFDVVATQRMIKALGTFGYQITVMNNDRYRGAIPRTVRRLRRLMPCCAQTAELGERMDRAGLLAI